METSETVSHSPVTSNPATNLSPDVLERMEVNRKAAQLKRKAILDKQNGTASGALPVSEVSVKPKRLKTGEEILRDEELKDVVSQGNVVRVQGYKLIDTGGGFLLDEKDLIEEEEAPKVILTEHPPIVENAPTCELCKHTFSTSFLYHTYDHSVCDSCRDSEGAHSYITRTDAKTEFLLKDEDFEKREPPLKFISRPNPHNPRWGDMKLYLRCLVEKRALEVWGSMEKIEAQRELREENRVKTKIKKYNKKMQGLRMAARSSLYTHDLSAHTHDWEDETYNEETDEYTHQCKDCGKTETYEKM